MYLVNETKQRRWNDILFILTYSITQKRRKHKWPKYKPKLIFPSAPYVSNYIRFRYERSEIGGNSDETSCPQACELKLPPSQINLSTQCPNGIISVSLLVIIGSTMETLYYYNQYTHKLIKCKDASCTFV